MKSQHCIDLVNGEIIWEHQYQNAGFAMVRNLYADGKLFARSGDDVIAYDATTGNLLWRIDDTYGLQTDGSMGYYQGNIYFTGIDVADIMHYPPMVFCLNAANGTLLWKAERIADGVAPNNFAFGIVIDQSTGYLYASDAKNIVCIDLNNTPLDITK
jgi:outer membrane protein assembly factor BamB